MHHDEIAALILFVIAIAVPVFVIGREILKERTK